MILPHLNFAIVIYKVHNLFILPLKSLKITILCNKIVFLMSIWSLL